MPSQYTSFTTIKHLGKFVNWGGVNFFNNNKKKKIGIAITTNNNNTEGDKEMRCLVQVSKKWLLRQLQSKIMIMNRI